MFDKEEAHRLVRDHHLAITVERYDSGQIGFVARPMINGRRFNRSFSTSVYGSLEEAAKAAINFCKGRQELTGQVRQSGLYPPIEPSIMTQFEQLTQKAKAAGIDPAGAYRDGIALHEKKSATELTLAQVLQNFMLAKQAENVTEPYLKELAGYYRPLEVQFGSMKMGAITAGEIESWIELLQRSGRIRSDGARKRWLLKLTYFWEFAVLSGRGWVKRNIIEEIREK